MVLLKAATVTVGRERGEFVGANVKVEAGRVIVDTKLE